MLQADGIVKLQVAQEGGGDPQMQYWANTGQLQGVGSDLGLGAA